MFLLVTVFAFLLRYINLTSIPVFADEAIYIRWAQVMKAESTLRFLPLSDGKQPLFMWSVIPMLKIFSDPLVAGRMVSLLSGVGTLLGVSALSYILFKSRRAALVTALIYTVSPFAILFDRLALVDSMLAMFGVWTAVFSILAVRNIRLDMAMLSGFALGGAALTKSPALFFAIFTPTAILFAKLPKKISKQVELLLKLIGLWGVTFSIAFAMHNILRLGPNFHMIGSRNLDYVYPLSHIFDTPLDPFLPHLDRALEWMRILGPELLLFFVFFGAIRNFSLKKKELIFLIVWSLMPILINSEYAKVFTARYIYFAVPFLYVLAGSSFAQKISGVGKSMMYLLLGIYVVHSLFSGITLIASPENARLPRSERSGYLEEWTAGTGIKESADYILEEHNSNPDVPIVVGTEGYFGTLPDGLQIYLQNVPNVTVIGIGLGINQIPIQLQESHEAGNATYMVANQSRMNFNGSFEDNGFEVIKKYKKATNPEGEVDYLYLLKVL